MILCPARLEPTFSPRPWGALSLAPLFPGMANLAEPFGEAWMTGAECRFANGPFARKKLGEAWPGMPLEWKGTSAIPGGHFPILVKFIFTEDKLSVQVHPDDDYASRHEQASGGCGKTEMWYAVNARPGAEVLVGLKSSVTIEKFKQAITDGSAEECLERILLRSGEVMFVPAGTAHTIGPGLVLCEIQQYSDLTYRVYDYNRPDARGHMRPLHVEKALDVIRFGKQTGGKVDPVHLKRGPLKETHYAACRYFATEKWEFTEPVTEATSRAHFDLLIFLEGKGSIQWGAERMEYAPAQVLLLPAALGEYRLVPEAPSSLLRTHVPSDLTELGRRLAEQGVSEAECSRLVHR